MAPMYAPVAPVPKLSNVMVAVAVASAAATENRRKTLIPLNLDIIHRGNATSTLLAQWR